MCEMKRVETDCKNYPFMSRSQVPSPKFFAIGPVATDGKRIDLCLTPAQCYIESLDPNARNETDDGNQTAKKKSI